VLACSKNIYLTTKIKKDAKDAQEQNSELPALRVLLGKYQRKSKKKKSSAGVRHTGESRYPGAVGCRKT
jgi:hypothetical protein